jgi:hypothetical protein
MSKPIAGLTESNPQDIDEVGMQERERNERCPWLREVSVDFAWAKMRGVIASDGKIVFSMGRFANIVNEKDIRDQYGSATVYNLLKSTSKPMSKFFDDTKNKAFTSADETNWWYVHNFTRTIFPDNIGQPYQTFKNVCTGPFGDEIKSFVHYVQTGGIPTKLFDKGGQGFTPVMTIYGLQKFLMRLPKNTETAKLRDIADQTFALWIEKNATAGTIKQLYRKDIEQLRAAGGAGIAAPPEPVLAV